MIGRAAKKERQSHRGQAFIEDVEERCVFQREHRGHPIETAVVDGEARLQTGNVRRQSGEQRRRAAQLARLGQIFRVEHGDERSAGKRHGDIEGARLGARRALGGDHDLMRRMRRVRPQRGGGGVVVGFDHEFHVELRSRIIEAVDRAGELIGDRSLLVERDDDRVDRQSRIALERFGVHGFLKARRAGEKPQKNAAKESACQEQGGRDAQKEDRSEKARRQSDQSEEQPADLSPTKAAART